MQVEVPLTLAQRCLAQVATDEEREDRLGDLAEAYAHDVSLFGEREARRRRERHVLSCLLSIAARRIGDFLQDQVLPATAALLIALTGYASLSRATAETWWIKSGFERNPGYFVSDNEIDYPVCQTTSAVSRHVTEVRSRVVVLPNSARIVGVSCSEPASSAWLSDTNYTRGRALVVVGSDAPARFWIHWED